MYAQIFLVTSVRGAFLTPQTFAKASDRVFGAKMPLPAFFIAKAIFFPVGLRRCLARSALLRRDLLQRGLGDRRLLRGRRGHSGLRGGRHSDRRMQVHANVEP